MHILRTIENNKFLITINLCSVEIYITVSEKLNCTCI